MKQLNTMVKPDEYLRLECLKLTLQLLDRRIFASPELARQGVQDFTDLLMAYVKTGQVVKPEAAKPQYRMQEVVDGSP